MMREIKKKKKKEREREKERNEDELSVIQERRKMYIFHGE